MSTEFAEFEKRLGYQFTDYAFLEQALTHGSSTARKMSDNERMEFFGDAILDFIICEYLYNSCPQSSEGELTEIKGDIVSRKSLAKAAREFEFRDVIRLGKGISGRNEIPSSVYANVFEAIITAVYLDGGMDAAKEVSLRLLSSQISVSVNHPRRSNYKSILQETVQKSPDSSMEYKVLSVSGPEHDRMFSVAVIVDGRECGRGEGRSKKSAEQEAARMAIQTIADSATC